MAPALRPFPTPPSSSVTITRTVYCPSAVKTWVPLTVPVTPCDPTRKLGIPASIVPSPQSIVAVCVSREPGSVKAALALYESSGAGSGEPASLEAIRNGRRLREIRVPLA